MDARAFAHETMLECRDEVVRVVQDLIAIPSRNTPPFGEEKAAQQYIAEYLRRAELDVDLYEPDTVPGLLEHPAYHGGRTYRDRPNLTSLLPGLGGGRSLLLTGHIDTVALGDNLWQHDPFTAQIHDDRLYGLGAIDMKGPLGAMLVLYTTLAKKAVPLRGALRLECVVDEEEGGVNATIAGRLRDGPMDGALLPEGTDMQIYPAARGALITDFIFTSTKGTWLDVGKSTEVTADAVKQLGYFLSHLDELSEIRNTVPVHPLYESYPDPVPVQVTKVYAGGWGNQVPIAVPPEGRVEVIMQAMPGEKRETVQAHLDQWLDSLVQRYPDVFLDRPEQVFRLRWMVPTEMDPDHPLVRTLEEAALEITGQRPPVLGAPYACDMFALHQIFGMPGVIFGPRGGQAHANDEYIELESLYHFFEALCLFVLRWCGV
jgi:acetylornithine deacetylase